MTLKIVSAIEIETACQQAWAMQRPVIEVLEQNLGWPPQESAQNLAEQLHLPLASMEFLHAHQPDFRILPFADAAQRHCVLLSHVPAEAGTHSAHRQILVGVLSDPFNEAHQAWAESRVGLPIHWHLAHPADLQAWLAIHEASMHALEINTEALHNHDAQSQITDLSLQSIAQDGSPVVRLVNSTIYDAMKLGASDIHLETFAGGLSIKYRVDGVLTTATSASGIGLADQAVSRIKVMAELDIAERRIPQDGRIKLRVNQREIDFRVSVMPSLHGEDVVIRVLDKEALSDELQGLRLDSLGFPSETMQGIRSLSGKPYGMFLVTGPTGSGKTTTLYAALSEINTGRDKIITIEDPVEYQLPGILQIPVNERKGLTFARGLRSILRHDPDKILVGEIRDTETAQIAIQSALTGHLVFTTVHANNVFDVVGRFLHMGVDLHSFVSALNGVLAQRLVRSLCPLCAEPYQPTAHELAGLSETCRQQTSQYFRARGCGACRGTGYKGRVAIGEVLIMNDELREMLIERKPIRQVKEHAQAKGLQFLRQAAERLIVQGSSSIEEIDRVTFAD